MTLQDCETEMQTQSTIQYADILSL